MGNDLSVDLSQFPDDISVKFLEQVFGQGFYTMTDIVPTGTAKVIGDLFGALNSFALVILVCMTIFYTATAVIGTAQEGTPLGRKLHTFWVPVRLITAAGMLVPVKNGLCLFQVLLLFCLGTSIEYANKLYSIYLGSTFEQTFSEQQIFSRLSEADKIGKTALSNVIYLEYMRHEYPNGSKSDKVSSGDGFRDDPWLNSNGRWNRLEANENSSGKPVPLGEDLYYRFYNPRSGKPWFKDDIGYNDLMGSIRISCKGSPVTNSFAICWEQANIIDNAINRIYTELIGPFRAYLNGQEGLGGFALDEKYRSIVKDLAKQLEENSRQLYQAKYDELKTDAKLKFNLYENMGWVSAGAIYHTMSNIISTTQASIKNTVDIRTGNAWTNPDYVIDDIKFKELKRIVLSTIEEIRTKELKQINKESALSEYFAEAGFDDRLFVDFLNWLTEDGNSINKISYIGNTLIDIAVVFLGIIITASIAPTVTLSVALSTVFYSIVAPLLVAGAVLAHYLPAIPLIIWILSLVGWLVVIVESLVATPIWIIGIARPEDEGFFGRGGQNGLFLFLGILIRPFGMLLGLVMASTLIDSVIRLLAQIFSLYVIDKGTDVDFSVPVITQLIQFFIFAMLVSSIYYKLFGLIGYIPDTIMQWLGAGGHHLHSENDEHGIKGSVRTGINHMGAYTANAGRTISGFAQAKNMATKNGNATQSGYDRTEKNENKGYSQT
ncbi:DotA/TraY family protein, partial [Brachyspira sp.]|uniref:DotA/TraY family protein n=1 Tax=Brachyspira sp. TaxID=1977261 RepID=UPI00345B75E3